MEMIKSGSYGGNGQKLSNKVQSMNERVTVVVIHMSS